MLSACPAPAQGNTGDQLRNAISLDIGQFGLTAVLLATGLTNGSLIVYLPLYVTWERVLTDHLVLSVLGSLRFTAAPLRPDVTWGLAGNVLPGLEWHPFDAGLGGFFLGVRGLIGYAHGDWLANPAGILSTGNPVDDVFTFGLNALVGWQFLLPGNMALEATVDYYYYARLSSLGLSAVPSLAPAITLGYRF